MKILYLASDHGLTFNMQGGAGTHMRNTVKAFEDHNNEVLKIIGGDVLAKTNNTTIHQKKNKKFRNIIIKVLPDKFRLLLREIRYLFVSRKIEAISIKNIIEFKPDVIYARSAYYDTFPLRIKKKLNIPLYLETSGCLVEIFSTIAGVFSFKLGNKIEKWKLQRSDFVVVEAETAVKYVSEKFSLKKEKIIAKPLGVNHETFNVDKTYQKKIIQKYNLENKYIIGFAGTFQEYHGIPLLLDAALKLKTLNSKIVFLIIGDGAQAAKYKKMKNENLLDNVIFTGYISRLLIPTYLDMFRCGVVPNCEKHMLPIKVFEYGLGYSCPAIPDYAPLRTVINSSNGITFKNNNAKDLAIQLDKLTNNNSTKMLAENWHLKVINNYNCFSVVKNVLGSMEKQIIKTAGRYK